MLEEFCWIKREREREEEEEEEEENKERKKESRWSGAGYETLKSTLATVLCVQLHDTLISAIVSQTLFCGKLVFREIWIDVP